MDDGSGFGDLLRELRLGAGLSQETLAERSRLSAGAISALERGVRRAPYRSSVDLLADGLGLSSDAREGLHRAAAGKRRPRGYAAQGASVPIATDRRGRLPSPLNSFRGRHREMAEIAELLERRRLVTLCGPGGVGKTRLAIEIAARHADHFPGGVRFVDLSTAANGPLVTTTLATALDVRARSGSALIDDVCVALESSNVLVVFDNCEHVLDAVALTVTALLMRCPALHALATSREALRVDGEFVVPVTALHVEPFSEAHSPAFDLFVDRAGDAGARLDLDAQREPILTICRRLDGIPLAIELAAARTAAFSPATIASMLDERFALLEDRGVTRPERHRTLRAALDWSYELLDTEEQTLFRRLAIFPGSWTLAGAAAVSDTGANQTRTTLRHGSLADRSLIAVVTSDGAYRYTYPETVRQYALMLLEESAEHSAVRQRLIEYALTIVEPIRRKTSFDESATIDAVDAEYPTVRGALENACSDPACFRFVHLLIEGVHLYWMLRGDVSEAIYWVSRALRLEDAGLEPRGIARSKLTLARFLRIHHRVSDAAALDDAALRTAEASGDELLRAEALTGIAGDQFARARFDAAYLLDAEAAKIFAEHGDDTRLANALHNLGALATLLGRYSEAANYLARSAEIVERAGDARGTAWVEFRRGFLAFAMGDMSAAEHHHQTSLELRRRCRDRSGIANSLQNVALLSARRGATTDAARLFQECLEIAISHGLVLRIIEVAERTAAMCFSAGMLEQAAHLFAGASAVRRRLECPMEPIDAEDLKSTIEGTIEATGSAAWDAMRASASRITLEKLAAETSVVLTILCDGDEERIGRFDGSFRAGDNGGMRSGVQDFVVVVEPP